MTSHRTRVPGLGGRRVKYAVGVLFLSVVILAVTAGCSRRPQIIMEVPESSFTQAVGGTPAATVRNSVSLASGQTVKVVLGSNATTGFKWEGPTISDKSVLTLATQKTEPDKGKTALPGAGGTETFVLKAVGKGSATATFEYSRPWAGGEKGVRQFILSVTVK